MSETMRALVLRQHGDLDVLKVENDYPRPSPGPGQVLLRVRASSFNYHDVFTVKGMPGIKVPMPVVIGLDLAGEVVACGEGVSGWEAGARVMVNPINRQKGLMGEMLDGGMAEYCVCSADQLIRLPDAVSFETAAALPVAYGTAHRMIVTHNTIKAGDKVLILGASGGVGTGAVLLAKKLGAYVVACAGGPEKCQRMLDIGADEAVDYTKVDYSKWAVERFGKPQRRSYEGGVDVLINFTGGDTWGPGLRCVKRGGKILVCGATAGFDPKEDLRFIWTFELQIIGSNSFYNEDFHSLLGMCASGEMKPLVDKVLPLDQAAEGLALIRDRKVIGKVVVTP